MLLYNYLQSDIRKNMHFHLYDCINIRFHRCDRRTLPASFRAGCLLLNRLGFFYRMLLILFMNCLVEIERVWIVFCTRSQNVVRFLFIFALLISSGSCHFCRCDFMNCWCFRACMMRNLLVVTDLASTHSSFFAISWYLQPVFSLFCSFQRLNNSKHIQLISVAR